MRSGLVSSVVAVTVVLLSSAIPLSARGPTMPVAVLSGDGSVQPQAGGQASAAASEADVRLMARATYVAFVYEAGDTVLPESSVYVPQEDRQALSAVRQLFRKWRRYVLVDNPADAQLLVVVRPGRRFLLGTGGGGGGRAVSAGISSPQSMLLVYDAEAGRPRTLMWRGWQERELDDPWTPLVEDLRAAVEAAARRL